MATVTSPRLLTVEDYKHFDEVLGFRDELIEGERVLSPAPIASHTAIVEQLERILNNQLPELGTEPLHVVRETGWKFHDPVSGADSVPIPDLMVILEEDFRRALKSLGWFEGVPLLVIEVVSPSERKARRLRKVGLYLDMGVPNVVEVDYTTRLIRIYTQEADSAVVYRQGDQVTAPFRATIDEIFAVLD
jgi:Uma2 family endonuclease